MARYTLVTKDGASLGSIELRGQNWREGDVIFRGSSAADLCVLDVLPSADADRSGILVVEEE